MVFDLVVIVQLVNVLLIIVKVVVLWPSLLWHHKRLILILEVLSVFARFSFIY